MAIRKILQLDEGSRAQLQRIVKRSGDWRERERAQTLLLLDSGLFAQAVADQLGLNVRTVRTTLYALAAKRSGFAARQAPQRSASKTRFHTH